MHIQETKTNLTQTRIILDLKILKKKIHKDHLALIKHYAKAFSMIYFWSQHIFAYKHASRTLIQDYTQAYQNATKFSIKNNIPPFNNLSKPKHQTENNIRSIYINDEIKHSLENQLPNINID